MPTYIVKDRGFVFPDGTDLTPTDTTPIVERCARFEGKRTAISGDIVEKIDEPKGFVDALLVEVVPIDGLEPISTDGGRTSFCRTMTDAAAQAKADRNYLISVAYYLSNKLTKFGKSTDDRFGPFAYSAAEWCKAWDSASAVDNSLRIQHAFQPFGQATVAAIRCGRAMQDFKASQNRFPTPVELFFFERLGNDGMRLLQLAPTDPCSKAFTTPPVPGSYGAAIATRNSGDLIKEVTEGLTKGFIDSRSDVERLPPHLRFYSDEDAAPWLAVARLMKTKNVETDTTTRAGLFKAILNGLGPADARSAAFVAFCVSQCGVHEAAQKVPANNTAGLATTWINWASAAREPWPAGSIVVTNLQGGKSSVGILAATPTSGNCVVYFCADTGAAAIEEKTLPTSTIDKIRWLDITGAGDATDPTLGSLSKKYESGKGGPGTVSTGVGDAGGVSYGTYQFSSATGSAAKFVASLPPALRARFDGMSPGSADFSAAWRAIASEDAAGFEKLQHDHIKSQFYDVLVTQVRPHLDINTRSAALQNCCWSTAVQHGATGGSSIVARVIQDLISGGAPPVGEIRAFDEQAIRRIYAERGQKNADTLVHFPNCSASVQASVSRRFVDELADALAMLNNP